MHCTTATSLLIILLASAGGTRAQTPTFAPVATYSSGGSAPQKVVVTDISGDGKPDILVANAFQSSVGVLLGNGNGTFQAVVTYNTGPNSTPTSIAVADINKDGKLDLLVPDFGTGKDFSRGHVSVLLGNGNGTFQVASQLTPTIGTVPYNIVVADLNADGQLDLVTSSYTVLSKTGTLSVLLNKGNGTFLAAVAYASSNAAELTVADVNGDGKLDVLTANTNTDNASVLLGNGDGTLGAEVIYSTGSGSKPMSIVVADVNADGRPDLVTANSSSSMVGVLLGAGPGTFRPVVPYGTGPTSGSYSVAVADINGDGRPDLLTANFDGGAAGVLLGNGDGTFQATTTHGVSRETRPAPMHIVAIDVNGDGKRDLITANFNVEEVGVLLNTTVYTPLATQTALPGATATLHPNPAATYATLTLGGLPAPVAQVQATLLDATGRAVRQCTLTASQGCARAEVPTAGLAPGLYMLRLATHDATGAPVGPLPTQRLSVR